MQINLIKTHPDAILPTYSHEGDAGLDLYSTMDLHLVSGCRWAVGTGIAISIPKGYYGAVCSRSGLAYRHGLIVANAPGIIDSGYTGEIKVILLNTGYSSFILKKGDRIAQLVISPFETAEFQVVDSLEESDRGVNGLGSTGV